MDPKKFAKPDLSAPANLSFEDVEVPEWGGWVRVQEMTAAAWDAWEDSSTVTDEKSGAQSRDIRNIRARLIVRSLADPETGKRLYQDGEADAMGRQPIHILNRLFGAAMRVNKTSEKDVEKLAKKSEAAPASGSSTSSAES